MSENNEAAETRSQAAETRSQAAETRSQAVFTGTQSQVVFATSPAIRSGNIQHDDIQGAAIGDRLKAALMASRDHPAAVAFSATFGVTGGYNLDLGDLTVDVLDLVTTTWRLAMLREQALSGILVSAVICEARAVYPTEFGCPPLGEPVARVTGESNPTFCKNALAYSDAVRRVCDDVRCCLKQTTVLLTIGPVVGETYYLRDPS